MNILSGQCNYKISKHVTLSLSFDPAYFIVSNDSFIYENIYHFNVYFAISNVSSMFPKILTVPGYNRLVSAGASTLWGGGQWQP